MDDNKSEYIKFYQSKYQKSYRKQNKEHIKELQKDLIALYSKEYLECPFCHKLINLMRVQYHLNSKFCKVIQENLPEDDYTKKAIEIKQNTNSLKSNLRLNNEEETDSIV